MIFVSDAVDERFAGKPAFLRENARQFSTDDQKAET
jgi:hypothetical protein